MASKQEKHLVDLTRQLREVTKTAEESLNDGLAVSTQTQQAKGAIQDLFGCLKGKTNGACLTFEEMNEAIAMAASNLVEFETEEQAASYDRWFRAKVEASRNDPRPSIPHEEAMARIAALIEERNKNRS